MKRMKTEEPLAGHEVKIEALSDVPLLEGDQK